LFATAVPQSSQSATRDLAGRPHRVINKLYRYGRRQVPARLGPTVPTPEAVVGRPVVVSDTDVLLMQQVALAARTPRRRRLSLERPQ